MLPVARLFEGSGLTTTARWFALVAIALVAGCSSSESFEEPAPLPEVVSEVAIDTVWSMGVDDGYDGQFLYLQPWLTEDSVYAISAHGRLVAANLQTGKRLWRADLDQHVMAGLGGDLKNLYAVTDNAELLAIDLQTRNIVWRLPLPNEVIAPPRSNGNQVLVQTIDGNVIAASAADGEKIWQYDGATPPLTFRATATPVVGPDIALVSFASGRLFSLDVNTGQPLWQYTVGQPEGRTELERLVDVAASPVVINTAALVVGYQGKLAFVDLRSGQEIWSREASSLQTPAVGNESIYLAAANGDVVAIDGRSRKELWRQSALAWRQLTHPVTVRNQLLVGDFRGYIHVMEQSSGRLVGQYEVDDEGLRVPPIQVSADRVLVFSNGGRLTVLSITPLSAPSSS